MIVLTHIPGMPVQMVEHVIRNYTKEYEYETNDEQLDGNLYRFLQPDTKVDKGENIVETINKYKNSDTIIQLNYPMETVHADQVIRLVDENLHSQDKHVFFICEDMNSAELVYLLFYYRHAITAWRGLDQLYIDCTLNAHHWNPDYTDYTLMQDWELRECFSICYSGIAEEWVDAQNHLNNSTIKVNFLDLMHKPHEAMKKIIIQCGLTLTNEQDLDTYLSDWKNNQRKELEEFKLIEMIVEATLNDQHLDWETIEPNAGQFLRGDTKLNTVSEAIIQYRLRQRGYEILCSGLNEFPTNSRALRSVLVNV